MSVLARCRHPPIIQCAYVDVPAGDLDDGVCAAAADVAHPHVEDLPLVVGDPEVHVGPLHADPQGDRVPLVAVAVLLDVLLVHPVVVLHNVRLLVNLLQEVVVVGIPVLRLLHRHQVEDDDVLCVYIYYIKDFFLS